MLNTFKKWARNFSPILRFIIPKILFPSKLALGKCTGGRADACGGTAAAENNNC